MNTRSRFALACSLPFAALAIAGVAAAQETTVIEQHKEIAAPTPPAPPATTTTVRKTVTRTGPAQVRAAAPRRKRPVHVVHVAHTAPPPARHLTIIKTDAAQQPPQPVATIDRKTVIHRHENGDVTRHTRVERRDADGTTTVVRHTSRTPGEDGDAPAGSPTDGQ